MPHTTTHRLRRYFFAAIVVSSTAAVGCLSSSEPSPSDMLNEARQAMEDGDDATARTMAEGASQNEAHAAHAEQILAELRRTRAQKHEHAGDYPRAHELFLEAASLESRRALRGQDYKQALINGQRARLEPSTLMAIGDKALQDRPHDPDIHRDIARLAEEQSDARRAITHYLWLFSADDSDLQAGLRLGVLYRGQQRPGDAVAVLSRLIDHHPEDAQIALQLAQAHADQGDHDDARSLFDGLLERFPDHPGLLNQIATFEQQRGNAERAQSYRERAMEASRTTSPQDMRPLR